MILLSRGERGAIKDKYGERRHHPGDTDAQGNQRLLEIETKIVLLLMWDLGGASSRLWLLKTTRIAIVDLTR